MNVIDDKYAYSLFPWATLEDRCGIERKAPCEVSSPSKELEHSKIRERYQARGWKSAPGLPSSRVSSLGEHAMYRDVRYLGDRMCWVVPHKGLCPQADFKFRRNVIWEQMVDPTGQFVMSKTRDLSYVFETV